MRSSRRWKVLIAVIVLGMQSLPVNAVMNGEEQTDNKWVVAITIKDGKRVKQIGRAHV